MWFLWACGPSTPDVNHRIDAVETVASEEDPLEGAQFDQAVLHHLDVKIAPEDWDALRFQRRSYYDLLGEGCMSGPWASPYTWFSAEVLLDGEKLGTVGIRKKGLIGSDNAERPSLRIDTDHFVEGQLFHGDEKLVFNNNNQDTGRLRTCLAHGFFADAGLVAPRCSFATVTVNGEDLGIYSHVENIAPALVERVTGRLPERMYEGTLSDFREGWLATFEPETEESSGEELEAVRTALEGDDAGLEERLAKVLAMEDFYTFWAAESLAGHWDGYNGNTNNFFVYADPADGLLRFIASGPDAAFDSRTPFGGGQPIWVATASALANRLIQTETGKANYEAALQRLLQEAWLRDERLSQLGNWKDLLSKVASRQELGAMAATWEVVSNRGADVESAMGERVSPPALRTEVCWKDHGSAELQFATSWGSYPSGDLYTGGSGSAAYRIDDVAYDIQYTGFSLGLSDDGRDILLAISTLAPDTFVATYVLFQPENLVPGKTLALDGHDAEAVLIYNTPDTGGQWVTGAYIANGTLSFDANSTQQNMYGTLKGVVEGG